jgi:hypothetical protein
MFLDATRGEGMNVESDRSNDRVGGRGRGRYEDRKEIINNIYDTRF